MRDIDSAATSSVVAPGEPAPRPARMGRVLRRLRDHGPASRGRLAADTGLSRTAAVALVEELEERGLVRRGEPVRRGVGRPGETVQIRGGAVCGLGAEINVDHVAATALDLSGEVVWEARRGVDGRRLLAEVVVDEAADLVRTTLAEVRAAGSTPVGLTVGVAGLVDPEQELVTLAPNLDWHDLPLGRLLRERLGEELPGGERGPGLTLANEADLATLAELDATAPERSDMVVLYGEVGLGGGVVVGGRPVAGAHERAGELGHLVLDPAGRRCACGSIGCWETLVGLPALLELATDPDDPIRDPALTLEERLAALVERARRGDGRTLAALHQVGGWLGRGAALLVNVLDPATVVLSGYFAAVGEWLVPAVEEQLVAHVHAPAPIGTRVLVSSHGPTAAVRGGALLSLEPVLTDPTRVHVPARPATYGGVR